MLSDNYCLLCFYLLQEPTAITAMELSTKQVLTVVLIFLIKLKVIIKLKLN